MNDTKITGQAGEDLAVEYLKKNGYRIRGRNVRFGNLEIDILAYDRIRKMMVFVEVKTRTRSRPGYPVSSAVDKRKRQALRRAIACWVNKNRYDGPGRLDLICIGDGKITDHIFDLGSDFF